MHIRRRRIGSAAPVCNGEATCSELLSRDNAALTRKRHRIYADILERTIDCLSEELRRDKDFVAEHGIEELVQPGPKPSRRKSYAGPR